jgi:CheY-like chemotaxis protein
VFGNTVQLQQALTNVINNAWQSMPNQTGRITLTHQLVTLNAELTGRAGQSVPEGRYSVVAITDNGQGMDAVTLDRVFEPFFTTRPGKGNGLGMPVVHGIMKSHDGGVMLQSDPGKGTTVYLYFPVQSAQTAAKSASNKPALPGGSGEHILFVDDESPLCMIGTKILERIGYKVTAFTSAQDAVALFKQRPNDFHLVVTDLTMPGMSGIDFADALIKIRPDIPIILATGYIEESIRDQADLLGFREIVLKPMTAANLAEAVKRILGKKS